MSKRNTDTGKWDKAWFRKLTPKMKCAWLFLLDKCDHAGLWDIDTALMSFMIGDEVRIEEIQDAFDGQIEIIEDKIWLVKFVQFQCGWPLSDKSRFHQKITQRLAEFDLIEKINEGVYIGSTDPIKRGQSKSKSISKSKSKSKSISKSKSKEGEYEGEIDFVIDEFNRITGSGFRKSTQAYRDKIRARLKEVDGDTQILIDVIELKNLDWKDDPEMRDYINPDTLFRPSKFPKYEQQVNQAKLRGDTAHSRSGGGKYQALRKAIQL